MRAFLSVPISISIKYLCGCEKLIKYSTAELPNIFKRDFCAAPYMMNISGRRWRWKPKQYLHFEGSIFGVHGRLTVAKKLARGSTLSRNRRSHRKFRFSILYESVEVEISRRRKRRKNKLSTLSPHQHSHHSTFMSHS